MEIVTICSVSGVHLDHVSLAANAGKHIICEKPLEINTQKIDQMIEICEQNNVFLSGIFPRLSMIRPIFSNMLLIREDLGRLFFVTAIKWWRSQEYYDSGAWRGTWI